MKTCINMLVIGNGFDLAHDLPTKYSDFLEFCKRVQLIWSYRKESDTQTKNFKRLYLDNWNTNESIRLEIEDAFNSRDVKYTNRENPEVFSNNHVLSEFHELITVNVWYEYFSKLYKENLIKGENWIDFESEIREIIQKVDQNSNSLLDSCKSVLKEISSDNDKCKKFSEILNQNGIEDWTIKDFRRKTYEDLERLTRALELYLSNFVNNIEIKQNIPEIANLSPNYVLDFNYTDTYERVYKKGEIFHIHGKADSDRKAEFNNMVLGIDEYWPENECDNHTNFTIFKKFVQRIEKHIGNDNYVWSNEIKNMYNAHKGWTGHKDILKDQRDGVSYINVFGHSLDVTDKDILAQLLGDEATAVTIYCRDKETEGELIANSIKMIGEQRLLEKANYVPSKFEFKIQGQVL